MIEIKNVSHRIGKKYVLNDIFLDLNRGGITALIGPNGAGKSTLLSLIARLQKLSFGTITIDDLEVGKCNNRDLAKKIAILPQSTSFTSRLTVRDLIAFGRYPYHLGRSSNDDDAMVDSAISTFALDEFSDRFIETLSGGQRQRALVAMACAQDTDYLLLDEPLNNLDIAASRLLMRQLRILANERKRMILIVLHDINYASAFADHIIVLSDGRVVNSGTPAETISNDLLQNVFQTDARVRQIEGQRVVLLN